MKYDFLIIGAGPAGYTAAIQAAHYGRSVVLFEEKAVGGTCLNVGCIPTKALIHASSFYAGMPAAERCGVHLEGKLDLDRMNAYKEETVITLRSGVESLLKGNKVEIVRGHAFIPSAHHVQCGGTDYEGETILIATGSEPVLPPIPGAQECGLLTSSDLLDLPAHPFTHLAVIGGGVIGCEFANLMLNLGRQVTIIEMKDRILPEMDREISQNLSMLLKRRGAEIRTGAGVTRLEKNRVWIGEQSVDCDAILMAVGRRSSCRDLFPEGLLETDRGSIRVNAEFATNIEGVYACGDCVHGIQLAHYAAACASAVVEKVCTGTSGIRLDTVPACVYLNQEIACVGRSEEQLKEQGVVYRTGRYSMLGNARSVIEKADRGFIKVLSAEDGTVLGAALMCERASDLIALFADAVANRQKVSELSSLIYPHPAFCEGIQEALEDTDKKAVHVLYGLHR
jgi:dihydrolipoamide dehydrogenase